MGQVLDTGAETGLTTSTSFRKSRILKRKGAGDGSVGGQERTILSIIIVETKPSVTNVAGSNGLEGWCGVTVGGQRETGVGRAARMDTVDFIFLHQMGNGVILGSYSS
jgi:hypothetical protein